jgi:hypothetical protein
MFRTMAVVAIVAALSGLPALAGVGTQEQPVNRGAIQQVAASQLPEGVGGAFEQFSSLVERWVEVLKTFLGSSEEMAKSPIISTGVGTQE